VRPSFEPVLKYYERFDLGERGLWSTHRGRGGTSPLTEIHRPCARQAVDVVGTPAYDPSRKWTLHRSGRDIVEVPEGPRMSGKGY
jgi:hypothetical protein